MNPQLLIDNLGVEGVKLLIGYMAEHGMLSTKQRMAYEKNCSRTLIDNRIKKGELSEIKLFKHISIVIDHERVDRDSSKTESTEKAI